MATTRTRKTLGRAGVGITVVALAAVGLLGYRAAADASANSTDKYRTVTAAAGTVTQVLSLSGTVHHVTQSSVSFPTSGRVTAVNVKAGDTVTAGQALASIDTTPLQNAVLAADAAYKSAIAQYETDQSAYSSSSTTTAATKKTTTASSTGFPTGGATTGAPGGGSSGGTGDPTAAAVKAAEDALAILKTGITSIETTLPTFVAECVPLIPTTTAAPGATVTQTVTQTATVTATVTHTATVTETATVTVPVVTGAAVKPSATPTASETTQTARAAAVTSTAASTASSSTSGSASTSTTPTATTSSAVTPACQAAIDTLTGLSTTMPDQMVAANLAIDAAVKALNAKAALLATQSSSGGSSAAAAAQQQAASLASANSAMQAAAAAAVGGAAARGGTVTEATLITDQATIEAARITLAAAQDQLSGATITSPIAGKVASIPFVVGQQASATAAAVVIGTGAIEVSVPVPLSKRPQVAVNQTASVSSTVGSTALTGTVSRISLLPTSTGFSLATTTGAAAGAAAAAAGSTTSTTYATVITVPTGGDALPEGSRVQVTITTKTVDAKVVLPASAVTPTGGTSGMVKVLTGSTVTEKRVVTGAVGESDIEIVSGLNPGEVVVIADASVPIAAASINTSRGSQNNQNNQQGGLEPNNGSAGGGQVPPGGGAGPTR